MRVADPLDMEGCCHHSVGAHPVGAYTQCGLSAKNFRSPRNSPLAGVSKDHMLLSPRSLVARSVCISALFLAAPLLRSQASTSPNEPSSVQSPVSSQAITVPSRIVSPIDNNTRVALPSAVHPLATARNDRGRLADTALLSRIQIFFKRSDAQEATLKQLVADLHNPASPSYHQWLTPTSFGQQFGPSDADVTAISTWLATQGFTVTKLNAGRQSLEFSGTAGQFRSAFHAELHQYAINGQLHTANASAPQIPAALSPVIGGFTSLNNFPLKSQLRQLGEATYNPATHQSAPTWTTGIPPNQSYILAPGDFAVQYDLNPLYTAGLNGAGQTIAIVNEANIDVYLVNQYRTLFGLSANPPQVILDGPDPGVDGNNQIDGPNGASVEAYLDVEQSGAVAPNATIDLVIAADTYLQSGLILAAEHAVYSNLAPVISLSFGGCELDQGTDNQFISGLWQQAAAQGITVVVATGDSGSAGCDDPDSQEYAVGGQAVSGFASTPYDVAVGGTDFYYSAYNQGSTALNTQISSYWNPTPSNNTPTVSIKGVIPEQPWDDSQFGLNALNYYALLGSTTIAGGSGGASTCGIPTVTAAGTACAPYPKPSWQTGTGVPADGVRDLPDVSLFAADGLNYTYYPICAVSGDCQAVTSAGTVQITGVGGTSAAAPSFAGIMALVNEKYGRQGQADYTLYPLARQFPAAFHDVTVGTNTEPCNIDVTSAGTAVDHCIAVSNPITVTDPTYGTATEGEIGTGTTAQYNANAGYDLASGLGSVDANVLVTDWSKVTFAATTTTLTPSSTTFTHGTSVTLTGNVTGTTTPTGSVAILTTDAEPLQAGQTVATLVNGAYTTGSIDYLPGGTYSIYAQYGGDGVNAPSTSASATLTVSPEASGTSLIVINNGATAGSILGFTTPTSISYGALLTLDAIVAPSAELNSAIDCNPLIAIIAVCPIYGSPTGSVVFTDNGTALGPQTLNIEGDAEFSYAASVGTHSVSASYSGDKSYNASASTVSAQYDNFTVIKNTPTLGLGASNATASGSVAGGQTTVLTLVVENSAAVDSLAAAPTGTVTLSGAPAGTNTTASLVSAIDPAIGVPQGVALFTVPAGIAPGTYGLTFTYNGDPNYNANSTAYRIPFSAATAGLSTPTLTASVSAPAPTPAASVAFTATVTGAVGKAAPTGTVTLYSSGYGFAQYALPASATDSVTITELLASASLFQGNQLITVQYSGDANYLPSASTVTIANNLSDFSINPATTYIAATSSGIATDTLTLTSYNGFANSVALTCSASGGITCSLAPASVNLTSGSSSTVTLNINTSAVTSAGIYNLVVTGTDSTGLYVHTIGLTVNTPLAITSSPGFTLASSPASLSVPTQGNTASSTIVVTPTGGFSGGVNLTCAITAPSSASEAPTCSIPSSVSVPAGATATATLSISTTAQTGRLKPLQLFPAMEGAGGAMLAVLAFLFIPAGSRNRRRWSAFAALAVAALLLGATSGCGNSTVNTGPTPTGGTSTGAYTVTVSGTDAATGKLTSTTTVSLTVN